MLKAILTPESYRVTIYHEFGFSKVKTDITIWRHNPEDHEEWIHVAQDRDQWRILVKMVMNLRRPRIS